MKVNSNQVTNNTGVIKNQNTATQFRAERPQKKGRSEENPKSIANKPVSESEVNEKKMMDVIEKANKAIEGTTCSFKYSVHDVTKQIMVKVIDRETHEVIKELPPEEILDMVAKIWEVAGILVDERR